MQQTQQGSRRPSSSRRDGERALGYLKRLCDGEGYLYGEAMTALLALGAGAVPPLIIALETGDHERQYQAAIVLGRLRDDRACMPLMVALGSTDAHVRSGAAYALGELGDGGAVPALIVALGDPDRVVRRLSAQALGKLKDGSAVTPLIAAFRTEQSGREAHREIAEALAALGDMAVLPLIDALRDPDSAVRAGAAVALGRLGDLRALLPLIHAFQNAFQNAFQKKEQAVKGDIDALCSMVAALGSLGDPRAVEPMIEKLTDPGCSWEVRCHLASVLSRMGDTRAVAPLIALLTQDDEDSDARCFAATALGRLGDGRAVTPLISCLQHQDNGWDLRSRTATALGELGDQRAVDPLRDALEDSDRRVRQVAARALRSLESQRADSGRPEKVRADDFARRDDPPFPVVRHLYVLCNRFVVRLRL